MLNDRALLYVIAQILGALAGSGILRALHASASGNNLCTPAPGPGITMAETFFIELLVTFVLLLAVFATCDSLRGFSGSGPLAIGLAISMCHLWAVSCTICSFYMYVAEFEADILLIYMPAVQWQQTTKQASYKLLEFAQTKKSGQWRSCNDTFRI